MAFPRRICRGLIEAFPYLYGPCPPLAFPRRICRGLIEARPFVMLATRKSQFPRRICRGLIEARLGTAILRNISRFRDEFVAASLKQLELVRELEGLMGFPGRIC